MGHDEQGGLVCDQDDERERTEPWSTDMMHYTLNVYLTIGRAKLEVWRFAECGESGSRRCSCHSSVKRFVSSPRVEDF